MMKMPARSSLGGIFMPISIHCDFYYCLPPFLFHLGAFHFLKKTIGLYYKRKRSKGIRCIRRFVSCK